MIDINDLEEFKKEAKESNKKKRNNKNSNKNKEIEVLDKTREKKNIDKSNIVLTIKQKEFIQNNENIKILKSIMKMMKNYEYNINDIENLIIVDIQKKEKIKENKIKRLKEKEEKKSNKSENTLIDINKYLSEDDDIKSLNYNINNKKERKKISKKK